MTVLRRRRNFFEALTRYDVTKKIDPAGHPKFLAVPPYFQDPGARRGSAEVISPDSKSEFPLDPWFIWNSVWFSRKITFQRSNE